MGRWEPGAADRLRQAALELFVEQGYEQTTVSDIAARAGLTARTFFRHFADRREVLFAGSHQLEARLVRALAEAPAACSPLQAVEVALNAVAAALTDRSWSTQRQLVISAHAELRERERSKLASLSAALAEGLRRRGVRDPQAVLAAEAGVAVFHVAFRRWVTQPDDQVLSVVLSESFGQLRALAAADT